jgi:hypothetical protein
LTGLQSLNSVGPAMKLTYSKAAELLYGTSRIEPEQGEGAGEASIKIAHNVAKLKPIVDLALETRKKLFSEIAGNRDSVPADDPVAKEVTSRMLEIDNTEVEVKLWRLKYGQIKQSKLTPDILNAVSPILDGIPDLGEPDA